MRGETTATTGCIHVCARIVQLGQRTEWGLVGREGEILFSANIIFFQWLRDIYKRHKEEKGND